MKTKLYLLSDALEIAAFSNVQGQTVFPYICVAFCDANDVARLK